ncbi:hypothetical protein HH214_21605 (plasmid) [Mucilaginibacter robiniae]|uniref:Plasmid transfer protein n=1 Tax=Mucilaginibacter robiniae TaxID=2728022 RepID=A0A7L5EDN1_9SPHI|nr:hypothetical protein [Mucilaginibacter robiniae]QJD98556.1 hypothetical protein HH214_21605 [Mucilaginibacter robiniae]
MKQLFTLIVLFLVFKQGYAQRVVFDPGHLAIVNSNGATRLSAELAYQASLEQIRKNTDDIAVNLTSVTLVQTMIHRSLTEINEAFKDAIQVKQMGYLINDIFRYSSDAMELAKGNPELLLFAEDATQQMKTRGLKVVADVSNIVLQQKENVLMNYNVRDELMRKVITELQIMNALMYTIRQNMYWAKMRGVIKSINPYSQYLEKDFSIVDDILRKRRMLK